MKRALLISALALAAVALGACGSPAPAAEPTLPPEPTVQPTQAAADPTAPVAPSESPTEAPAAGEPTLVEITLADNTIASSLTSFKAGSTYRFSVTNNGRHEHNFNITPPVSSVGSIAAALDAAVLSIDDTQLPPGGSASVEFTFPASAVGADLEFNCLIRRHYDDGMRIQITVTG